MSDSLQPVDCSPPSSSVHGILQARILEWFAISFSRGSSRPRDRTEVLFDLKRNYGGGNEDNGDLLQKVPCTPRCTQSPQACSRPLLIRTSTGDSWTPTGKSGSVSCGVSAPFSWVLVHTRFYLCPSSVYFPVLCKFWWLYGGVNGDLLQEGLLMLLHLEPPPLRQATADLSLRRKHSNTVLA